MMSINAPLRIHTASLAAAMVPVFVAALAAFAVILMPQPLLEAALAPISNTPPSVTERAWLALGAAVSCAAIGLAIMVEIWSARLAARKPAPRSMACPNEFVRSPVAVREAALTGTQEHDLLAQPQASEVLLPLGQPVAPSARTVADKEPVAPDPEVEAPSETVNAPSTHTPQIEDVAAKAGVRQKPAARIEPVRKVSGTPAFPAPSPDANITLLLERLERGLDRRARMKRHAAEAQTPLRSVLEELRRKAVNH